MKQAGTEERRRGALLVAVILAGSGVLAACGSTPRPSPSVVPPSASVVPPSPSVVPPSPSAVPVVSPTPDERPRTTAPVTAGGYRWTPVDTGLGGVKLGAVTSTADQRLIAVGNAIMDEAPDGTPGPPTIWASVNGTAWTQISNGLAFESRRDRWEEIVVDIVSSGNGLVAVGREQEDDASAADAAAWFSKDGTRWTRATVMDGIFRTMDQVLATDNGLVAFGEAGYDHRAGFGDGTAIWTSPDGRRWTPLPDREAPPIGTRLGIVGASTGEFLATADFEHSEGGDSDRQPVTAGIWRSADALHWEPIPGSPLGVNDIARVADGFVAVGSGEEDHGANAIAWRSTDGRTGTGATLPRPPGLAAGTIVWVYELVDGPAGLLAFGKREDDYSSVVWSSPDGATWTLLDLTAILDGATIDHSYTAKGAIVLLGTRSTAGADEPAAWLLTS